MLGLGLLACSGLFIVKFDFFYGTRVTSQCIFTQCSCLGRVGEEISRRVKVGAAICRRVAAMFSACIDMGVVGAEVCSVVIRRAP